MHTALAINNAADPGISAWHHLMILAQRGSQRELLASYFPTIIGAPKYNRAPLHSWTFMSAIANRITSFLHRKQQPYCESCLVAHLMVASRDAMREALQSEHLTVRNGVCCGCRGRKRVVHGKMNVAA
jgi:hypothetical protein